VEQLLVAARGEEVRYLVRMLSLNLRVGAVRTTILTALGRALALTPPSGEEPSGLGESKGKGKAKLKDKDDEIWRKMMDAESLVKQVYVRHPHFGHIVDAALDSGLGRLSDNVQLSVGEAMFLLNTKYVYSFKRRDTASSYPWLSYSFSGRNI
jgi:DNA ligase-1